jgi:hypothetical protein
VATNPPSANTRNFLTARSPRATSESRIQLAAEIADKTVANAIVNGISERYDSISGKKLGVDFLGMTCLTVSARDTSWNYARHNSRDGLPIGVMGEEEEIEDCGLMIDDLKRFSNREVREGKKKGARAFLPVSSLTTELRHSWEHGHSCPCLSSWIFYRPCAP